VADLAAYRGFIGAGGENFRPDKLPGHARPKIAIRSGPHFSGALLACIGGNLVWRVTMPTLPSGRRIEFSLDRFHALLGRMDRDCACEIADLLNDPDDLLNVLDVVHFGADDTPFFAGYVASGWMAYAAEWSSTDRQALRDLLASDETRFRRAEAIDYVKATLLGAANRAITYPYVNPGDIRCSGSIEAPRLRQ
jgi:hypothetical protein